MLRYALNPRSKISARAYGRALRISTKNSIIVCRSINNKNLQKGKSFLQGLIDKKRDINGKYYTKTATEILNILSSAERNAEAKSLDLTKLIINASAHKGFTFMRPRRFKMRRQKRKITNIQIVLIQK